MRHTLPPSIVIGLCAVACEPRGEAPESSSWARAVAASLDVTVLDDAGQPIDDAWVHLDRPRDARVGPDGVARLRRLAPGRVHVRATAPGFVDAELPVDLGTQSSLTLHLRPLDLRTTLVVHGLDAAGAPAAGVQVRVDGEPLAVLDEGGRAEIAGLPPGDHLVQLDPDATDRVPVTLGTVALVPAGRLELDAVVPSRPPPDASGTGSEPCALCHPAQGRPWADSGHARAGRAPGALVGDAQGLDLGFADGRVVDLGIDGAQAVLGQDGPGDWWVEVRDRLGTTTGRAPVAWVYGAQRHGAALALQLQDGWALAPVAWAAAGRGLGALQPEADWISAYADAWFDPDGLLATDGEVVPPDASFDRRCGGCHTSHFALDEDDGSWALERADGQPGGPERTVGCEACHGLGSVHRRRTSDRSGTIHDPGDLPAEARLRVCARCHERVTATDHPFSAPVEHPVGADGRPPDPWQGLEGLAEPARSTWVGLEASRVHADQVGDLRASPHRSGPAGFLGACEDCHDPHGTAHTASLRADPWDNALCTGCHASAFPDTAAQAAHAAHRTFSTGPWAPGSCVGCHLPRSGAVIRRDVLTGVGEVRDHTLHARTPDDVLAAFDAAAAERLPPQDVPVDGCIDCHAQRHADAKLDGLGCPCPQGDAGWRLTWESFRVAFYDRFPGAR